MSDVTKLMEYVAELDAALLVKMNLILELEKKNEFQGDLIETLQENLGHREADCDNWEKIVETRDIMITGFKKIIEKRDAQIGQLEDTLKN